MSVPRELVNRRVLARKALRGDWLLLAVFLLACAILWWPHLADRAAWQSPPLRRWLQVAAVMVGWLLLAAVSRRRGRSASRVPTGAFDQAADHTEALPIAAASVPAGTQADAPADPPPRTTVMRVVYASQTGFAEQLARQTLQSLQSAGISAQLQEFGATTLELLGDGALTLFVVSTTGEGDPPDNVAAFFDRHMQQPADLSGLRYGVLALGDSDYDEFCGFGHALQRWLQSSGAHAAFDLVEVDSEDEGALRRWQQHLATLTGAHDLPDWQAPRYQDWALLERRELNAGSAGDPCYLLRLRPLRGSLSWHAGDVAEVGPCHSAETVHRWLAAHQLDGAATVTVARERLTLQSLLQRSRLPADAAVEGMDADGVAAIAQRLPHRAYSIASLPADGTLDLLVRQTRAGGAAVGLGASWLTTHTPIGTTLAVRVRSNPGFHAPVGDCPLILIGNGTGMAALHALLQARVAARRTRNWLLFGERRAVHDYFYRADIERWHLDGHLQRLDLAWSRDQPTRVHVQQRLREAGTHLQHWVADGAEILVCGSAAGMAQGVDDVMREVLGDVLVNQLRATGRYRRDVY